MWPLQILSMDLRIDQKIAFNQNLISTDYFVKRLNCCVIYDRTLLTVQCDQIERFFKVLGYKFSYKSSQNISRHFGHAAW